MARLIGEVPAKAQATYPSRKSASSLPPGVRPNKFGGRCPNCGGWVEPGAGRLDNIDSKWVVSHIQPCPDTSPEPEVVEMADHAEEQGVIFDGDYTVEREDHHRTFNLRTQPQDADFMPGVQIIRFLSGPDNENDFTQFGHIKGGRLYVWKSFRQNGTLVADAEHFITDPSAALKSARCFRCHRKLTVPTSVHQGYGPECVNLV